MRYALIENNQVKDVFKEPDGFSIQECFCPEVASMYIPCPFNISEGDFYDPNTNQFSENPDKKFPSYADWYHSMVSKTQQLSEYALELNPTINGLPMNFARLTEYKTTLSLVISGVDDVVEIDGKEFTGDDFKLMISALKKFNEDKQSVEIEHSNKINSLNNFEYIITYDFTTGWPETTISI
jgi:hypothetical protein